MRCEGFAEIAVDGTLFVDLTGATEADAPVVYVRSAGGAEPLPVSFRRLIATADYPQIDS